MITLPDLCNPGICGRLGNQMFELAAAFAHAKRTGHELVVPECEVGRLVGGPLRVVSRGALPAPTLVYREPAYPYRPLPKPRFPGEVLALHGYFQSHKYWEEYADDVGEFLFPADAKVFYEAITANGELHGDRDLVALCVRRGDYVEKQSYHPLQPMSYYETAVSMFPGADFLVCSDDLPWCKENLKFPNLKFLEEKGPHDPWRKLWTLSFCDHFIIANSSYHWWAAWLGPNERKRVVAPKLWFGPASGLQDQTFDLIPDSWTRI